jgi:hypothetical protein
VRLNTCTETAIARDDSEIGRFGLRFSSKKDMDIEIGFLAEKSDFAIFIECRLLSLSDRWAEHWLCLLSTSIGLCTTVPYPSMAKWEAYMCITDLNSAVSSKRCCGFGTFV